MTGHDIDYDVAIVGASLAGATAATLLARQGLRVALVEKHRSPSTHKVLCTHFIQSSATPTLRRLGLAERIEAAGGKPNPYQMWTRYGWIKPSFDGDTGYNIRRSALDPMVRELAGQTPGVDLMLGQRVAGLIERDGAVAGVQIRDRERHVRDVRSRLVVGADGHKSAVAWLAGIEEKQRPNARFYCLGYFAGVEMPTAATSPSVRSQLWMRDGDYGFALPNDGEVTALAAMALKRHLPAFRQDREAALRRFIRDLPEAPVIDDAELVSEVVIADEYPLIERPAVPQPGLALIGDAALTSDPVPAVGCGWAFQSGEWLADAVGPALRGSEPLTAGLRRYERAHRFVRRHHRLIAQDSSGKPFNAVQLQVIAASARDRELADRFEAWVSRRAPAFDLMSPSTVARAVRVNRRHRRSQRGEQGKDPSRPAMAETTEADPAARL